MSFSSSPALAAPLVAALLLAAPAAPALADPPAGKAAQDPRTLPLKKVFPFHDRYAALPAELRDGFSLTYTLTAKEGGRLPDIFVMDQGRRVPLRLGPDGRVLNLDQLSAARDATVTASGPPASLTMEVTPTVALSRRIEAGALRNAVADLGAARGRAGPAALLMPSLNGLLFEGVGGGQAVRSDGRRIELPRGEGGAPVFRPREPSMRDVVAVEFPTVPRKAVFTR